MPFVCSLAENGEYSIDLLKRSSEFIARVPVGYDDATDDVFSAVVALSPMAGYAPAEGYFELIFSIIESDRSGLHLCERWDGLETKPIIPDAVHRRLIRSVVCCSVEHLIDAAWPAVVSMSTHEACLPEPALRKYHEIAGVFRGKGYEAGMADSWHGQMIWMMNLLGQGNP